MEKKHAVSKTGTQIFKTPNNMSFLIIIICCTDTEATLALMSYVCTGVITPAWGILWIEEPAERTRFDHYEDRHALQ